MTNYPVGISLKLLSSNYQWISLVNAKAVLPNKIACLQDQGQLQRQVKKPLKGRGTVGLACILASVLSGKCYERAGREEEITYLVLTKIKLCFGRVLIDWLGLDCFGADMPFKSHWFIVWKVETVIVVLHNSFEALVYSLALLDFLFVMLRPSIGSCPSSFPLLSMLQ